MAMHAARRIACALGLAFCASQASAAEKPYEFGVFPNLPLARIYELHAPMASEFEAKLGRPVRLSSKAAYAAFGDELRNETYDIALVQPFDYVDAHDKHGYLPLARRGEALEAVIVVRQDSPLASIKDLKGRIVSNPPENAAVSHLTSMAFRDAGIDPQTGLKRYYGKNHFACLQSVVIGAADACGTSEQALRTIEKQKSQPSVPFRILHKTASIPHALFVAHKRVPQKERDVLLRTILEWPNTETGRKILDAGHFVPFVAARDADYEVVRRYIRGKE
jgi:phosphonate transport system substrate-binding protein